MACERCVGGGMLLHLMRGKYQMSSSGVGLLVGGGSGWGCSGMGQ